MSKLIDSRVSNAKWYLVAKRGMQQTTLTNCTPYGAAALRPLGNGSIGWCCAARCHRSDANCCVSVSAFCSCHFLLASSLCAFALCLLVHISSDILLIYAFYALDMQFSCCCYSCRLLLMTSSLASCSIPQVVAAALSALLRLVCCRLSRDIYYV